MKAYKKSYRMRRVLSFALSVLIKVYWYRIRKKSEGEWEKLWEEIGHTFREMLFELEGLLIKVGQLLSIRADLLPNGFIKQIQDLVDHVPPSTWQEIQKVLQREWDGAIEQKLTSLQTEAVASASIGEVYRGKLKDGTDVAVKVQRPNIQSIVQTDFRTLSIIIWFAHHFAPVPKGFINFKLLFQELKQVIEKELDFKKEMETAISFQKRFNHISGLKIPKVYTDLCSSKVLVMEWVEGVRITDTNFLDQHNIVRKELVQRLFRIFLPQWLEAGTFHADPHAGNIHVMADGTMVLLDFGMVGEISKKDANNFQELVEAILLKNYTKAVDALMDLGLFLPDVDPKQVEKILAEALSFDLKEFKEKDLFAVKKEINDFVRTLPIQVPTRFVFLGRSFVTIEGITRTLQPDQEMIELVKPAFKEWLDNSNTSKWQLALKWLNAQPIVKIIHSIPDFLQGPQRLLEQKEIQMEKVLYFRKYENQKQRSFYLGLVGILGVYFGINAHDTILWNGSLGIIGISILGYIYFNFRQKKWMKKK